MIRFSQAIQDLAELERALEDNPDLALAEFDHLVDNAQEAIDRRAMFLNAMASRIEDLKRLEAQIKAHRVRIEGAHQWFTNQTMTFMREHPEWTWQGKVHKFRIQKNGGKQAVAWAPLAEPTELKRVLSPFAEVPPEWVETHTVRLIKPGFEDAVREGRAETPSLTVMPRSERLVIG